MTTETIGQTTLDISPEHRGPLGTVGHGLAVGTVATGKGAWIGTRETGKFLGNVLAYPVRRTVLAGQRRIGKLRLYDISYAEFVNELIEWDLHVQAMEKAGREIG